MQKENDYESIQIFSEIDDKELVKNKQEVQTDTITFKNLNISSITNTDIPAKEKEISENSTYSPIFTNYKIERVETLSDVFAQGKIYLTVNKQYSSLDLERLCEKITTDYDQYNNIVICLYSDTETGKKLALGDDQDITMEQERGNWLALYSYNAVEGAYFDDNPTGYLGGNQF